ncbi:MAG TPA: ABC transporter ATP-binding protein [Methylomirabilota bacterium]|nr:ABC transporter ATP-binding protein [Methylomirabilota bacterium]
MAWIDLIDVSKTLSDPQRAGTAPTSFSIDKLSLRIPDGKTTVILGPSGCGKTTLLKIIAGLIRPDAGEVRNDGRDVKDLRPGDRRIGMVFQNYALYPHLTSRTNVLSYFLFRRRTPELDAVARAKYQRTSELMGVDLAYLLDRKPTTLSGGEKQRVALGRCITRDAALFLVDEPFANLDQALREKYRVNLKILLRQFSITTVYVTHDHNEALILADMLAIMNRGRIEQVGTFEDVYDRPKNLFVAAFLNLHVDTPPLSVIAVPQRLPGAEGAVRIGVRPEDVEVSPQEDAAGRPGVVSHVVSIPMKHVTVVTVRVGADDVHARIPGAQPYTAGDRVWIRFRRYHVFDAATGERRESCGPAATTSGPCSPGD